MVALVPSPSYLSTILTLYRRSIAPVLVMLMVPTAPIHHLVALPLDSQTYTSYSLLKSSCFYPNYSLSHFNLPPNALPILVPYNDPILPLHILEADINKKGETGRSA